MTVGLQLLEENGMVAQLPAMLLRVARSLMEQQRTDSAAAVLTLAIYHLTCPEVSDDAAALLRQLEFMLSDNYPAGNGNYGQTLPRTQVIDVLNSIQNKTFRQPVPNTELSRRELDVVRLIAEGLSNAEIAQRLCLSIGTVKVHTRNIYGKLGVCSRTQATISAQRLGIL